METRAGALQSIQALRTVAALAVVTFHALGYVAQAGYSVPAPVGAFGVDVFFVISGFVMVLATQRPTTPRRFIADRLARIVPLYWSATTIKVALLLALPTLGALHFSLPHVLASYAFVPWLDSTGAARPIVQVGWTLTYELWFYAIFATFHFNVNRTALAIGALAIAGMWISAPMIIETLTAPIILEFVMGAAIGLAYVGKPYGLAAAVACIALLLPGERAFCWGAPSAVLVAGCVAVERWWPRTALSRIGDSSYALYLTHAFVLPIYCVVAARLAPGAPGCLALSAAVALCVAVGHVTHLTVERWLARRVRHISYDPLRLSEPAAAIGISETTPAKVAC